MASCYHYYDIMSLILHTFAREICFISFNNLECSVILFCSDFCLVFGVAFYIPM